jgi:hypothetical protein
MFTLRIVRHDRNEQVLAECQSGCVPARGEVLRVVGVTLHVPSIMSNEPRDGSALAVQLVEVTVLPDVAVLHELSSAAQEILSESRM